MSLAQDFKAFIMRGNVVDLAVGMVVGTAFSGIVKSLVDDVIMPPTTPPVQAAPPHPKTPPA